MLLPCYLKTEPLHLFFFDQVLYLPLFLTELPARCLEFHKHYLFVIELDAIYRGTDVDLWLDPGPLRVRTTAHRSLELGEEVWLELPVEALVILDE